MTYLYQAIKAVLADWLETAWAALKAKAAEIWQKLRARNTGDK